MRKKITEDGRAYIDISEEQREGTVYLKPLLYVSKSSKQVNANFINPALKELYSKNGIDIKNLNELSGSGGMVTSSYMEPLGCEHELELTTNRKGKIVARCKKCIFEHEISGQEELSVNIPLQEEAIKQLEEIATGLNVTKEFIIQEFIYGLLNSKCSHIPGGEGKAAEWMENFKSHIESDRS